MRKNLIAALLIGATVLPALQHKSAEAVVVSRLTTGKNLFFVQAITGNITVRLADTTIIAIIFTVVGKLD